MVKLSARLLWKFLSNQPQSCKVSSFSSGLITNPNVALNSMWFSWSIIHIFAGFWSRAECLHAAAVGGSQWGVWQSLRSQGTLHLCQQILQRHHGLLGREPQRQEAWPWPQTQVAGHVSISTTEHLLEHFIHSFIFVLFKSLGNLQNVLKFKHFSLYIWYGGCDVKLIVRCQDTNI